jgi:hypothetical protein
LSRSINLISKKKKKKIYRAHTYIGSLPVEEHRHSRFAFAFLEEATQRLRYFGSNETLAPLSCNSQLSQPVPVESFWEKDDSELGQMKKKMGLLLSGIRNADITKINEVIEEDRAMHSSSELMDSERLVKQLSYSLGDLLLGAFQRTKKIEYLNESISIHRECLERPLPPFLRFGSLSQLCVSLSIRAGYFKDHSAQDMKELVKILPQHINDGHPSLAERVQTACFWAIYARRVRHPSTSTAYETAMSLRQDTLLVIPTLQLQHATLVKTPSTSYRMPLDYASYQIDLQKLEEAIETLEKGRALLWFEMRDLRLSIDQLLKADPNLGHAYAAVNQDLEELTKSIPPSHRLSMGDGVADDLRAIDPFCRLLLK